MEERGPPVQVLSDFIKSLVAQANSVMAAAPKQAGESGSVVVGLKPPARSRVWIVAASSGDESKLTKILKAPLEAVPAPAVIGLNAFALNFDARGGSGAKPAGFPIPDEWKRAMAKTGAGMLPDAPLKAIWSD